MLGPTSPVGWLRRTLGSRPLFAALMGCTALGSAAVIWRAMGDLEAYVKVPVALLAAAVNVVIGAAYLVTDEAVPDE